MTDPELVYLFEKHIDHLNWSYLCRNESLYVDFFEKHLDKIDWIFLCFNNNISFDFFQKHMEHIEIAFLFANENVPLDFIKDHIDEIHWGYLYQNRNIPLSFYEENVDKINLEQLASELDFDFEEFSKKYNRQNCIENFYTRKTRLDILKIIENSDCINWGWIFLNKVIPENIMHLYLDKANLEDFSYYGDFSAEFFERHIDKIEWSSICFNVNLPESFFEKYENKMDCNISFYKCMSEKFLESRLHMHENFRSFWELLCENKVVSESFFEKYFDKIKMHREWISNNNLSIQFIDDHFDHVIHYDYYEDLSKNNFKNYFLRKRREFMKPLIEEINENYYSPPGHNKAFPKGGYGFQEMLEKYK